MVLDESAAAARQRPAAAADLRLQPLDALNDTASLPHRIAFLNRLHEEVGLDVGRPAVCMLQRLLC